MILAMKNLAVYYLAILTPLVLIILGLKQGRIDHMLFALLLFVYLLVYRTLTDGFRLYEKGVLSKKEMWKIILPGYHFKYFKELYFK